MKQTRKLIDIAINGYGDTLVKYQYTEVFDSPVVGEQKTNIYIGEWENPQTIKEALHNETNK